MKELIDNTQLKEASEVLRALAHPLRLKIMQFIDENQSVNVNRIYKELQLEQSITSQHLSILRNSRLVRTTRNGKFINYKVNYSKIGDNVRSISSFLQKKV